MYTAATPNLPQDLDPKYATMDGHEQEAALSAQHEALSQTDFSNGGGPASSFATATGKAFSNRFTQPGSQVMLREADDVNLPVPNYENIPVSKSYASTQSNVVVRDKNVDNGMIVSFGAEAPHQPAPRKKTLRGAPHQRIELFGHQ